MRSAAEPEFVIEFTVGNEAHPHAADTEEPEFIFYLNAPQLAIVATLLSSLRSLGNIASPFPSDKVEWTLVEAFDGAMELADQVLRLHPDHVGVLQQQVIADLPRTLGAALDEVLRYVRLHAPPYAVCTVHGNLH